MLGETCSWAYKHAEAQCGVTRMVCGKSGRACTLDGFTGRLTVQAARQELTVQSKGSSFVPSDSHATAYISVPSYTAEQVSHHPPISAMHIHNDSLGITLEGAAQSKLRLQSPPFLVSLSTLRSDWYCNVVGLEKSLLIMQNWRF